MKIALDPTPFHHAHRLLEFPARGGRPRLQVHADDPARRFHPLLQPPEGRRRAGGPAEGGLQGRGNRNRVGAARAALVRPGRGRPRGRRPLLEARHPDHRGPGRRHHEHRIQRPAGEGRGIRAGLLPLHGGTAPHHRAGGDRPADRSAPGRLRRGGPGRDPGDPRAELEERGPGLRGLAQLPHEERTAGDHAGRGRQAAPGPRRRHHGPPRLARAALHHQPARQPRPGAPAPENRRRRRQLGRVLRRPAGDRLPGP